jgi:hypothetical protein
MGTSYSILDRDVEASDEMRAVILARDNGIEPSSARFAGENDGVGFWVGRRANGEGVSLLVYPNDQDWVIGCGAGGMKVSGPAGTYGLVVDGAPIPDNGNAPVRQRVRRRALSAQAERSRTTESTPIAAPATSMIHPKRGSLLPTMPQIPVAMKPRAAMTPMIM